MNKNKQAGYRLCTLMPHLIEEMADVIISVDLMKELCGIADEDVQKEIERTE